MTVGRVGFFAEPALQGQSPTLASCFYLDNVPYRWNRGTRERLPEQGGGIDDASHSYRVETRDDIEETCP